MVAGVKSWWRAGYTTLTLGPLDGSRFVEDLLRGVLAPALRLTALEGAERLFAASRRAIVRDLQPTHNVPFLLVRPGDDVSEAASSARFLLSALPQQSADDEPPGSK